MLIAACEKGNIELITQLLESGEDLEQRDRQGYTPLLTAAKLGYIEIISTLLKAGSNIEALNNTRQTPLFIACWSGHEEAVKYLIRKGANVNHQDKRGWTPLIISVYQDLENIVKILLDSGCDPEKTDCFNKQAIDRAKSVKMMELIKKAVSNNRKSKRKSSTSSTPNWTPSSTPRSSRTESDLTIPKHSKSFKTPDVETKFRKALKEKVDKKVRDSFFDGKANICSDLSKVFINVLEDEKTKASEEVRHKVQELVKSKTWDLFGKLKSFSQELLKQARPGCEARQKSENKKKHKKRPSSPEIPKNEIMKNRLKESIRVGIKDSLEIEKIELQGYIQNYIEKEFFRLKPIEKSDQVQQLPEQKKKTLSHVPQFDVSLSLKGFLTSENDEKSQKETFAQYKMLGLGNK